MGSSAIRIQKRHSSASGATLLSGDNSVRPPSAAEDDARLAVALMERICRGDETAFAMLLRQHSERFYRVAYRFTGSRHEAEDIVQEAFLKLWAKPFLWQADRGTAFTTWFYRIVVNLCLDYKKKKRPASIADDTWMEDDRDSQEEVLLQNEKQQWLARQIAALPGRQRMALNLCFYEEISNQDAAAMMGIRVGALESLLIRAKTEIKNALKKHGELV